MKLFRSRYVVLPAIAVTLLAAGTASAHGAMRGFRGAGLEVADALGMSMEEIKEAKKDGITFEQLAQQKGVDLEAIREEHRAEHMAHREERHQALADALGVTVEELEQARKDGVSIAQLAEQQGVDLTAFHEQMREQHIADMKDRMQALVDEGKISQELADERIARMSEKMDTKFEMMQSGMFDGKMRFGRHGRR